MYPYLLYSFNYYIKSGRLCQASFAQYLTNMPHPDISRMRHTTSSILSGGNSRRQSRRHNPVRNNSKQKFWSPVRCRFHPRWIYNGMPCRKHRSQIPQNCKQNCYSWRDLWLQTNCSLSAYSAMLCGRLPKSNSGSRGVPGYRHKWKHRIQVWSCFFLLLLIFLRLRRTTDSVRLQYWQYFSLLCVKNGLVKPPKL